MGRSAANLPLPPVAWHPGDTDMKELRRQCCRLQGLRVDVLSPCSHTILRTALPKPASGQSTSGWMLKRAKVYFPRPYWGIPPPLPVDSLAYAIGCDGGFPLRMRCEGIEQKPHYFLEDMRSSHHTQQSCSLQLSHVCCAILSHFWALSDVTSEIRQDNNIIMVTWFYFSLFLLIEKMCKHIW